MTSRGFREQKAQCGRRAQWAGKEMNWDVYLGWIVKGLQEPCPAVWPLCCRGQGGSSGLWASLRQLVWRRGQR